MAKRITDSKKGGVEFGKSRRNIMGTLSFEFKLPNMRKMQEFIVYPAKSGDMSIMIQSGTRIGQINMSNGVGVMSQSHANGAYGVHLATDQLVPFRLSDEQLTALKEDLAKTAGTLVGSSVVKSDNSGADKFEDGGQLNKQRMPHENKQGIVYGLVNLNKLTNKYDHFSRDIFSIDLRSNELPQTLIYPDYIDAGFMTYDPDQYNLVRDLTNNLLYARLKLWDMVNRNFVDPKKNPYFEEYERRKIWYSQNFDFLGEKPKGSKSIEYTYLQIIKKYNVLLNENPAEAEELAMKSLYLIIPRR